MATQDSTNASPRRAASGPAGGPRSGAHGTWRDRCGIPSHGFAPDIPGLGMAGKGPTPAMQELELEKLLSSGSRALEALSQHMVDGRPGMGRYGSGRLARQLAAVARTGLAQALSQTTQTTDADGAALMGLIRRLLMAGEVEMRKKGGQDLVGRGGHKKG